MAGKDLEELLVSSEAQTARDRLEDYDAAELAADAYPHGEQELEDLREALVGTARGGPNAARSDSPRAGASAGEPQHDPGDSAGLSRVVRAASSSRAARGWHASDITGQAGRVPEIGGWDMTILTARAGTLTEGVAAPPAAFTGRRRHHDD